MSTFMLHQIHGLVDATSVIAGLPLVDLVDLKFSPEMFSIIANASPSSRCVIALQLFPQFFKGYFCHKLQYSWIYTATFYPILFDLERNGCSSFTFSFADRDRAALTFDTPNGRSREVELSLSPSNESMDVPEFDYGAFVSIHSQEFINIVPALGNFDSVLVTVTNSQVKLSHGRINIILTQKRGQCIIGGVVATNQIDFVIPLQPTVTLCNLARRSERVWLFKSKNSSKGVISVPLGLYARFLAYFPDRMLHGKAASLQKMMYAI